MKTLIIPLLACLTSLSLCSCVAVWGSGHKVAYSNSEGMLIQFDPAISGQAHIAQIAQTEADKYGRVIVPGAHEPSPYSGIHQRYYKFITPTKGGRTEY